MRYVFIILILFSEILICATKREVAYLVTSEKQELPDTLYIENYIGIEDNLTENQIYKPSNKSRFLESFQNLRKKESEYGYFFQLAHNGLLKPLDNFAPLLYPKSLEIGESIEGLELPNLFKEDENKFSINLTEEQKESLKQMTNEEKAEFIQKMGKKTLDSLKNKNADYSPKVNNEIEILADYRVIDEIFYENPIVKDYVIVLEAVANSPKGEYKAIYYYHNYLGFVYLTFVYDNTKYELSLNSLKISNYIEENK